LLIGIGIQVCKAVGLDVSPGCRRTRNRARPSLTPGVMPDSVRHPGAAEDMGLQSILYDNFYNNYNT